MKLRAHRVVFSLMIGLILATGGSALAAKKRVGRKARRSVRLPRHAVSVELLGRAGIYSLNYDYLLDPEIALGLGASYFAGTAAGGSGNVWLVPIYGNYYFSRQGESRGFGTIGGDLSFSSVEAGGLSADKQVFLPVIGGGYEYRGRDGFLFRAAPYLIFGSKTSLWFGISFGGTF